MVKITPAHLGVLEEMLGEGNEEIKVKALVIGGEALLSERMRYWEERVEEGGKLINEYGPTETVVGSVAYEMKREGREGGVVAIGKPIWNTRVYVKDERQGVVGRGVKGELYIGGEGVARGYYGRAELTAERFVPDENSKVGGERIYRTGDVCRHGGEGELEYVGRKDQQVKVRGYRIELGEIEAALSEHPGVKEAVVMAREDQGTEKRLVAYVVKQSQGEPVTSKALREYLGQRLPDYMMPVAYVEMPKMPLNANGKIDRQALPAPEAESSQAESFQPPRTEIERMLAGIWAEVIGVTRVGINDNFFELGGDSILSIQIVARANKAGVRLVSRQIFDHQTIRELAEVATVNETSEAGPETVAGEVELTPIQEWFFRQEIGNPNHYNHAVMLEARQEMEPALVRKVVSKLVEHHDALRLRYCREGAEWKQEMSVAGSQEVVTVIDLGELSAGEKSDAIAEAAERLQGSLDI